MVKKMKKNFKIMLISTIVVLLDQIIKLLVVNHLESITIIPNFFSFTYALNKGAAFSILFGKRIIIILISVILISAITYFYCKEYKDDESGVTTICFGLLYGGIIGNFIDRIVRGFVIDYVSVLSFPIFNLADICITISVFILIINSFKKPKDKSF